MTLDIHLLDGADTPAQASPSLTSPGRFGGKGIGLLASIALTVNNISGAGMLEFPQMFQRAGWLPATLSLGLVCIISTLFATTLSDTIARIPGNKNFRLRIEFSDVFEKYFGRRTALLTQAVFYLNLLSQNLAAIVACAQMFDSLAGIKPGYSYALRLSPSPTGWVRWDASSCASAKHSPLEQCVPFSAEGDDALLITTGYVATALLLAPLGLLTLEENMAQQKLSFVALLLCTARFLHAFYTSGLSAGHVPCVGEHWVDAIGVVIFNFAFCVTVPSWLNEKAQGVSVNRVFWTSTITSTLLYTAVGFLGGRAFANAPENMLSIMLSPRVALGTQLCGILFGVLIIGLVSACGSPTPHTEHSRRPYHSAHVALLPGIYSQALPLPPSLRHVGRAHLHRAHEVQSRKRRPVLRGLGARLVEPAAVGDGVDALPGQRDPQAADLLGAAPQRLHRLPHARFRHPRLARGCAQARSLLPSALCIDRRRRRRR